MTVRSAREQDIPAIIELLKLSLGESLMPKSEAFWRWKHVENPFGISDVLLGFEEGQLIGVRAFMRWEWKLKNKIYKAVRAVDTATHPDHQGKGIFSRLTLQLVEHCKKEGIDFIFNTPNKISKPGYLKMGWSDHGRAKIYFKPVWPGSKQIDFENNYQINNGLTPFPDEFGQNADLITNYSEEFLNWRYVKNPNVKYQSFSDHETNPTYRTIFRLKSRPSGIEFRICNAFKKSKIDEKMYRNQLERVVKKSGANLVTSAVNTNLFPTLPLNIGPSITTRTLSIENELLNFDLWKPSLGDLEVF